MATWRTNGVVLASDDEGDFSDSQSSLENEPARGGLDVADANEKEDSTDSEDELAKDGYELPSAGSSGRRPRVSAASHKETPSRDPQPNSATRLSSPTVSDVLAEDDELPDISIIKRRTEREHAGLGDGSTRLSGTSPTAERVFKVPQAFVSQESRQESIKVNSWTGHGSSSSQAEDSRLNEMGIDDISKSYVQLSSPLSSPPLPLANTPLEPEASRHTSTAEQAPASSAQTMPKMGGEASSINVHTQPAPSDQPIRRSFRPRNVLQKHPYSIEMAQYRNTLHGAGYLPLVFVENEEENTRRQDEYSQETEEDSQEANFIADSSPQPQQVFDDDSDDPFRPLEPIGGSRLNALRENIPEDIDDPFRPLSPIRHGSPQISSTEQNSRKHDHRGSDDEDSDDLPDIGQIMKRKVKASTQASGSRKRPRTYKANRTTSLAISNQSGLDIYDFPPSPPITSPTPNSEAVQRILNRVSSLGSRRSSPSTQTRNDNSRAPTIALPPASASRRSVEVIPVDTDSENEDQRSLSGASSSSSPEPEDRIRRVAKRIRGVLPASWLRLDKKPHAPKSPSRRARESETASPERDLPKRGVAIRKTIRDKTPSTSQNALDPYFLDEESESDSENFNHHAMRLGNEAEIGPSQMGQSLADSLFDDAVEDDRIDRMLPPRKRASTVPDARPSKRRRISNKLFHGHGSGHARQPKITEQFSRAQTSLTNIQKPGFTSQQSGQKKHRRKPARKSKAAKFVPPRLSILDIAEPSSQASKDAPLFIRIASRSARSRKQLGRHSPNRKFIRLDNVDDTADAQIVLRQWREGTIRPNQSLRYAGPLPISSRQPTSKSARSQVNRSTVHIPQSHGRAPRRLVVSKGHQTTLDEVVRSVESHDTNLPARETHNPLPMLRRNGQPLHPRPLAQPAQLETEERDYNRSHPNAGFGTTKKGLDRLYRRAHRGVAVKGDVQLARFLADPDAVGSVADDDVSYQADVPPSAQQDLLATRTPFPIRRRKKSPQHLDAGAHRYRQPSEPLPVSEALLPANPNLGACSTAGKLLNLQPYGTRYTYHFEVFPLQSGIFFHETTLIGSGRLSRILDTSFPQRNYWAPCTPCSYVLDEKSMRWAEWDATVSSEMGLCFDWILGQLEGGAPLATTLSDILDFILNYVEQHLFFTGQGDHEQLIGRICEIVDGFLARGCGEDIINATTIQPVVEILSRVLVLQMQLLRMCQKLSKDFTLVRGVEDTLQSASEKCVALLLTVGLDKVRNFYEECQYLSSREAGVRRNRYFVEAWVITMKVLQSAKIPRSSFWDVLNKGLLSGNLDAVEDARVFEGVWYKMFSLLPLTEFDNEGVVRPGLRHTISNENWALPQKLMKRIFTMYATKSRQSAAFNDYVRNLFIRCHHLMVEWGWRRCGGLIGTLFDFFASHNLAHLRNEESFNSPRFLEELDVEPSLSVAAEDKCFHIFLKLVATSLKHMREGNDVKGIRNLVPRLLPNHDRQYPKEEAIHQRDLSALRNHHDLLCTLFWAAPAELRPPVILLQQLVIPERSHKEACLINLRAWSNLARFLLASSPVPQEFQQLVNWQKSSFFSLIHRYRMAEDDIRQQHAALPESVQQQHSEQSLSEVIEKNKEQVVAEMVSHIQTWMSLFKRSGHKTTDPKTMDSNTMTPADLEVSRTVFLSCLPSVTSVLEIRDSSPPLPAIEKALRFALCYFDISEKNERLPTVTNFEESEAFLLGASGCLFGFNDSKFLAALEAIVLQMLERKLDGIDETIVFRVWGRVSAYQARRQDLYQNNVTILQTKVGKWVSGHAYPPYDAKRIRIYAPLFMANFIQRTSEGTLRRALAQRDLFQEWLCSMAKPEELFRFEYFWTVSVVQSHQLPTALLRDDNPYLPRNIVLMKSTSNPRAVLDEDHGEKKAELSNLQRGQFTTIEGVFKYIADAHKEAPANADGAPIRSRLVSVLKSLMVTLKSDYEEAFHAKSPNHQNFVRRVISSFKTYVNDVCPLDKFFSEPGTIYYHPKADGPNFFVPMLIHHGLRMSDGRGEQKFLYYCFESIKNIVIKEKEGPRLRGLLLQAMDHDIKSNERSMNTTKAIIQKFAPAVVWAAFQNLEGFLLADLILEIIEEQVLIVGRIHVELAAEIVMPVVCVLARELDLTNVRSIRWTCRRLVYLFTKAARFMTALWPTLSAAIIPHCAGGLELEFSMGRIRSFMILVATWEPAHLLHQARFGHTLPRSLQQGSEAPEFGEVIRKEYTTNWELRDEKIWARMPANGATSNTSHPTAEMAVVTGIGVQELPSIEKLVDELQDAAKVFVFSNDGVHPKEKAVIEKRKELFDKAARGLYHLGL